MGTSFCSRRGVARVGWLGGPLLASVALGMHHIGFWRFHMQDATVPTVALTLVLAPLLEELAFRGGLQELLRSGFRVFEVADRQPLSWANLLTTVVFCACHLPSHSVQLALAIAIPSIFLGYLFEITRSLTLCVAMHMWFNTCLLMAFWWM